MAIAAWLIQTAVGRALTAVLIGGIGWIGFSQYYQHKGAVKERAKFERAGQVNAGKANKARREINRTPDEKLFDGYARD